MKKILGILAIICLIPMSSWGTTTLSYKYDAPVGDSFTVQLFADFTDDILGWGFDFYFNDTALDLTQTAINTSFWSAMGSKDGDGLSASALDWSDPVSGSGILLATLSFKILKVDDYNFGFGITSGDLTEGFILSDNPLKFDEVQPLTTPIPEPATLLLVGLGLLGLAGVSRKKLQQ